MVADRFVLDASALLALFLDEPGAARMQELLRQAVEGAFELYMSTVNLGEVLYAVELRAGLEAAQDTLGFIDQSPIRLVNVDRPLALLAARIKAGEGMGYLDSFVVAIAQKIDAVIVTQDADFKQFDGRLSIEWLD